jgi:hypothetical protein
MARHPAYRPDPPAHHVAARRLCFMCRQTFDSSWQGERICPECKNGEGFAARTALPEQFL